MPINSWEESALLKDVPVGEAGRVDKLEFSSTAEVLARAAIGTQNPFTIGIYGNWGAGKTSLMRIIMKKVEEEKSVISVWFNAWKYEKEDHLILPLVATINRELSRKRTKATDKIRKALRSIAYNFSVKTKVGIPFISEIVFMLSPKNTIFSRSLYFDAFVELSRQSDGKMVPRIIVFIDDLDRCLPDKAVKLLEQIKLVLGQQGFTFVLGVNEEIIDSMVEKIFIKDLELSPFRSEDYLDKIIQVKVPVPKRKPDEMDSYIGSLLEEGKVFAENSKKDVIPLIAEAGRLNPRSIIRLLNRIIVTSRIGTLEQKDYDPLALLLNEATNERRYEDFCKAIDITVILDTEEKTRISIGEYLADELKKYKGTHDEFADLSYLVKTKILSRKNEFMKAVETLQKNEHLFNLLSSDTGRKWLSEKKYRQMLGEASERMMGERKSKKETPTEGKDIIRELLDNMVRIPAEEFMMGSEEDEREKPVHKVTLESFEISAIPVTQNQYETIMGENLSYFKGPDNPVENVTWDKAIEFCEKLSQRTGERFTIPTEAQWEYACRAGNQGKWCCGDNESQFGDYAWYYKNSEGKTHPVGLKQPNDWGLYDMHGNVWEWCLDHWHENYRNAPDDGSAGESGGDSSLRVRRGGCWGNDAKHCRSAYRGYAPSVLCSNNLGFRLCLKAGGR